MKPPTEEELLNYAHEAMSVLSDAWSEAIVALGDLTPAQRHDVVTAYFSPEVEALLIEDAAGGDLNEEDDE